MRPLWRARRCCGRSGELVAVAAALASSSLFAGALAGPAPAYAATAPVALGTAGTFGVLAGTTVTNTGPSNVDANLGVSPGTAVTGFPPGIVTGGTIHSADGVAAGAQSDLTTAYNDAAGRSPTANVPAFIGAGQTLTPGVYKASSSLDIGGSLTLSGGGNAGAVFVFQAPSTLITDSASTVILANGAQACNVFWQVGSSATLGTGSSFTGTVLALTSISITTGTTVNGRALARNGAVTLDDDTISVSACATVVAAPTVTGLSPTSGAVAGGTSVTLTGTGFTGATAVDFGTTAATNLTVVSGTTITADAPAGTGTVDVTVTTPAGTSATSPADQFSYVVAAPTVTGLSPTSGAVAGEALVTLTGIGFTGATAVDFGTTAATNLTVVTGTTITADAPAGTGTVDVTVTTRPAPAPRRPPTSSPTLRRPLRRLSPSCRPPPHRP